MRYLVTLQYANRAQFTPSVRRVDGSGYSPERFAADTPLAAARLCYEKYRKENAKSPLSSGVPLDFAIVIAEAEDGDRGPASIASLFERYVTVPASDIIT